MKSKHFFLITILTLSNLLLSAQISNIINVPKENSSAFFTYENNTWIFYWNDSGLLKIYDSNGNFQKSIQVPNEAGYVVHWVTGVSKKLFNGDNKFEYLATYFKSDTYTYKLKLYNESNNLLYDFGNSYNPVIFYTSDGARLFTISSSGYSYYKISESSSTVYSPSNTDMLTYPNPTTDFIHLPYRIDVNKSTIIKVFDINGKLMESVIVPGTENEYILSTTTYPPGIYNYTYENFTGRFIVSK